MHKFAAAATLATGATAVALGLSTPAFAAPATLSITTTNGGSVTATNSGAINFKDTTAGITASCTTGKGTGSVPNATYSHAANPVAVGSLSSLSLTNCSGAGITFTLTANTTGSHVNATDVTTSNVTPGSITGVSIHASALSGLCTLDVDGPGGAGSHTGSLGGTYNNLTGALTSSGVSNMKLYNVSLGCLGLVHNGDTGTLTGTFIVKNSGGTFPKITSTTP